jgi:hypothetical protein
MRRLILIRPFSLQGVTRPPCGPHEDLKTLRIKHMTHDQVSQSPGAFQ